MSAAKLLGLGAATVVAAIVMSSWAEIERYRRIRKM
jgi:hypothetical protein